MNTKHQWSVKAPDSVHNCFARSSQELTAKTGNNMLPSTLQNNCLYLADLENVCEVGKAYQPMSKEIKHGIWSSALQIFWDFCMISEGNVAAIVTELRSIQAGQISSIVFAERLYMRPWLPWDCEYVNRAHLQNLVITKFVRASLTF